MFKKHIPKSELLQKYVDGIYTVEEFQGSKGHFAFPFLGNVFGLYYKTKVTLTESSITYKSSPNVDAKLVLFGKYIYPIYVRYEDYITEIFINFKLGGANNFFDKKLHQLAPNTFQFIEDHEFSNLIKKANTIDDIDEKIETVEALLLEKFREKENKDIEQCIEMLYINPNIKVSELANHFKVSSKTINRWFQDYTCFSPSEIKRIIKFRNAIQTKNNFPDKNLTSICYENKFYDSSNFGKEFKKMTSMSPKEFFKNIDKELLKNSTLPFDFNS